jgi:uncharacterized BrkB/YihY/UPF0761 family membrane protein
MDRECGVTDRVVLRRLLGLFAVFAGVCLLAGASRMHPPAWQLASLGGDVMRVREALSMFVFAPAISVVFWLIYRALGRGRSHAAVDVLMVLSIYCLACGMGMHDPANRMAFVYGRTGALMPEVRRSLMFFDDQVGHWIFWGGFVLGTWVLGIQQAFAPLEQKMGAPWRVGLGAVSAALLWVMLTNLWDEYPKTRVDLGVIAAAAALPLGVQVSWCRGMSLLRLPVLAVIYPAYLGSIAGTLVCWLIRYGRV